MDFSPSDGLFPVPNGCVGRPCADEVKVYTVLLLFCPGGAMIDTPPTTPQVTTPQSLVGEGRSGVVSALLLRHSGLLPVITSSALLFSRPGTSSSALLLC